MSVLKQLFQAFLGTTVGLSILVILNKVSSLNSTYCPTNFDYDKKAFIDYTDYECRDSILILIEGYRKENKNYIKHLIIENPSNILFKVDWTILNRLEKLTLSANDWGCDAIKTIPTGMLEIKSLRMITLFHERFPYEEKQRIKKNHKKIRFKGKHECYLREWDSTYNNGL